MAEKKENPVFAKSKEQVAAEKVASDNEVVKYKNEALAQRAARFASLGSSVSPTAVRQARQEIIDRKAPLLDPENRGTVKPIDNPIPVRHEGEEPGESDKGESDTLVKIRPDVQDNTLQPEGHQVPPELQLHGVTGDGGVMPVESRARQMHPLADGVEPLKDDAPELFATTAGPVTETIPESSKPEIEENTQTSNFNVLAENGTVIQDAGDNKPAEPVTELEPLQDNAEQDPGPRDPEGEAKGKKVLADGTTLDAEGERHADQPEGHNPKESADTIPEGESDKDRLERLRETYKTKFGKPANARWSADHLQGLIDEKV